MRPRSSLLLVRPIRLIPCGRVTDEAESSLQRRMNEFDFICITLWIIPIGNNHVNSIRYHMPRANRVLGRLLSPSRTYFGVHEPVTAKHLTNPCAASTGDVEEGGVRKQNGQSYTQTDSKSRPYRSFNVVAQSPTGQAHLSPQVIAKQSHL